MFANYLLIAWRTLKRDKLFAALNIIGLAIGVVACLLIYIYVQDELSFDAHHRKADRIFRIQAHYHFGDTKDDFGITPFPIMEVLLQEYPEIEAGVSLFQLGETTLEYNGQRFSAENGYNADTSTFRAFDFTFTHGGRDALDEPDNIVIMQEMATRMFGAQHPIGKLVARNGRTLKVAGVIDEKAGNTHIPMGVFMSRLGLPPEAKEQLAQSWGNNSCFNYLVLAPGTSASGFQGKMDAFVAKHILPRWEGWGFKGDIRFNLEPLRDVHFNNELIYDTPKKGNKAYVTLFAIVAVLILAIACINYINMSTADATRRAKEVALRKVSGAQRGQLVAQFIGGSVLIAVIGIVVALGLLWLCLPAFNSITGKEIGMGYLLRGSFFAVVGLIVLAIGVVAGSYPAFFLSRFSPQLLLKEGIASGAGRQRVRKVLMGAQFAIALFMVVGTLAVFAQLHWLRSTDMGFRKENLLTITMPQPPGPDTLAWDALRPVKQELMRESFVTGAAFTQSLPGNSGGRWVLRVVTPDGKVDKPMPTMNVDPDFPGVLGLELVAGRMFDPSIASDNDRAVVVNESAVRSFGWKDPLAEKIYVPGDSSEQELSVIGVVKDFHYASLHTPIEPMCLFQSDRRYGVSNLVLRLAPGDPAAQLEALQARWKELRPNDAWEASFLTDSIAQLYQAEDKLFRVFTSFAVLTILLTIMGLYGLAYFTAKQRTREIGIRRVMGAPLADIVKRMNREFVVLLGFALLVAFPLAFYAIGRWLETFAYHTEISPMLYAAAVLITLSVTVLTVTVQAYRAAVADPVKALRHE
ncbi:MAG: ABC transporter permease [Flavobacteriales bacterium]|jgi:putative ABC transport system permease protein|nr:ABC transporter permease [Flavobacteriales bacterium]